MLTVNECLDFYYFEHISKKAVAKRRAEYAIEALKRHIGDRPIYDIDVPACREYNDERSAEGAAEATARRELGVLQAAARHCVKWRKLKADQLPSIELPPDSQPMRTWLFKDELNTLLEVASKADRRVFRFVQIAYHTGSRKRAIEALKWDQIDLDARRVNLQGDSPTTKKKRPIVPISEAMAEELRLLHDKATTPFVLVTDADIRSTFDPIAKKAGLEFLKKKGLREAGRLTPHVLRHSRATHLLQDGKSPWVVASLLGDTLPTVLRVYGHACPSYLAETLT